MFFVLGGGADTCLRNWADVTFAENLLFNDVKWNGSRWVAIGGYGGYGPYHQAQYSDDGSTWTLGTGLNYPIAPDQIEYSRVEWDGTYWGMLSDQALSAKNYGRSTDGATWTYGNTNNIFNDFGYTGSLLSRTVSSIGSKLYCGVSSNRNVLMKSTDGCATWAPTSATLPSTALWGGCATNGTTTVCISTSGTNAAYGSGTNLDTISWSAATLPNSVAWHSVIWTGRIFFAFSTNNPLTGLARSYDGITWEDMPSYPDPGVAQTFGGWAIACADSRGTIYLTPSYMASATSNDRVWISVDDGETWCENTTSEAVSCFGGLGTDGTRVIAPPHTQGASAPTKIGSYGVR